MSQILLVEDTKAIREPLAQLLRLEGYSVSCAANGVEALAFLREERPDLVLLDLMMPEMDGLTFLSIVRLSSNYQGLPVMLFTSTTERIGDAERFGIEGYCPKASGNVNEILERIKSQVPS